MITQWAGAPVPYLNKHNPHWNFLEIYWICIASLEISPIKLVTTGWSLVSDLKNTCSLAWSTPIYSFLLTTPFVCAFPLEKNAGVFLPDYSRNTSVLTAVDCRMLQTDDRRGGVSKGPQSQDSHLSWAFTVKTRGILPSACDRGVIRWDIPRVLPITKAYSPGWEILPEACLRGCKAFLPSHPLEPLLSPQVEGKTAWTEQSVCVWGGGTRKMTAQNHRPSKMQAFNHKVTEELSASYFKNTTDSKENAL